MNAKQERQKDVWVKWGWLWKVIFYAAVIVSTWLMLLDDDRIHIYGKLGVDDRTAAVTTALEKGIITLAR